MKALPGETAEQIYDFIVTVLDKHNLKFENLTSFSADNAAVNFGGAAQKGNNNVFFY